MVNPKVDLVVLTRHAGPLHPAVQEGIHAQQGVQLIVHRLIGTRADEDRCRWEAIVRARNKGKTCGDTPWLMFLDDDVVLDPWCVSTLLRELTGRPLYGALAADYLREGCEGEIARHVAMGATLFRREALKQICFTWRSKTCECQCCCDDLREHHWGIDYCRTAKALHLPKDDNREDVTSDGEGCCSRMESASGRVLTAFNRRHLRLFTTRFLSSLRATGNRELVIPLAIGLYPSERRRLIRETGVKPIFRSENGQTVARRRLRDFIDITSSLPPLAAVAYWDAGDVIFQGKLQPLWELVRANPEKLLAVREPSGHPENPAVAKWTQSIFDLSARRAAQKAIYHRAFLNGGFAAGTASAMNKYFRNVANWYDTATLAGSKDWGDQLALNVYCHTHPEAWQEVSESWNYCLCRRNRKTMYRNKDGRYMDSRGVSVNVVHGNANSLGAAVFRRKTF